MSIRMIIVILTAIFLSVSAAAWAALASWEIEGSQALESRNYPLALRIYQRAAKQGEVKSSYHIGLVYAFQEDWKKKMFWWLKGAEEGDSIAQFEVAQIFLGPETSGMGFVPQDYVQAYKWYELAAKDPSGPFAKDGIEGRDMAAAHMTPAQIKQAQALVRKWKPMAVTTVEDEYDTAVKKYAPGKLPVEAYAEQVFKHRNDWAVGGGLVNIDSFKKTDGQKSSMFGVDYYTLEYEAVVSFPKGTNEPCIRWGNSGLSLYNEWGEGGFHECGLSNFNISPSGQPVRVTGTVRFKKTENGWRSGK